MGKISGGLNAEIRLGMIENGLGTEKIGLPRKKVCRNFRRREGRDTSKTGRWTSRFRAATTRLEKGFMRLAFVRCI